MKLFNPSPERIVVAYHGTHYLIEPNHYIDLSPDSGRWILDRWAFVGLVDITPTSLDKSKITHFIVQRTLEGLDRYIQHCHDVIEGFMKLDTELKVINVYGTVMKDKNVKRMTSLLEIAVRQVKDTEAKYGISIAKADMEERVEGLLGSIDTIIAEVDADENRAMKERERDVELDQTLKNVLNDSILTRSSGALI